MKTTITKLLALFSLSISLVSANVQVWQDQLNYNQQVWKNQNILHYNYQYTERSGPNPPQAAHYPWTIEIRNGAGGSAMTADGLHISWTKPPNMEAFFGRVQTEINGNPRSMNVVYSHLGYPATIYVLRANGEIYDVSLHNFVSANSLFQELESNKATWAAHNLFNYNYLYTERAGPNPTHVPNPWYIEVRNKQGAHAQDGAGSPITFTRPPTVNEFFYRVEMELRAGPKNIHVAYNRPYGFPEHIYVIRKDNTLYDVSLHNLVPMARRALANNEQRGLRGVATA